MLSVTCCRMMLNIRSSVSAPRDTDGRRRPAALRLVGHSGCTSAFMTPTSGARFEPRAPWSGDRKTLCVPPLPTPLKVVTPASPPPSAAGESIKSLVAIFPLPPTPPPRSDSPVELAYMTSLNSMTSPRLSSEKSSASMWKLRSKASQSGGFRIVSANHDCGADAQGDAERRRGSGSMPPSPATSAPMCLPSELEAFRDPIIAYRSRRASTGNTGSLIITNMASSREEA